MKFSIIIPAFNEEKYLPQCLDALTGLDYPKDEYEIIVVDNGSTDRTREIAEFYNANVLIDETKTVSGLRNLGAEKAKGDILAFVDADCMVIRDWLQKAEVYSLSEDICAWGSPPVIPEKSTWVQKTWFIVRKKDRNIQEVDWLESMNLFIRQKTFREINGFNEELVTCEDVDLCYRLKKYGKIVSDSRIVVVHHGEAKTVKHFFKKEMWRGKSNLKGITSHKITVKEISSLIIPLYFGFLMPLLFIILMMFQSFNLLIVFVILLLLPAFAAIFKIRGKINKFTDIIKLFILVYVYFSARTLAIIPFGKN